MRNRIKVLVIVNTVFGYDGISSVATNYYRYQDKTQVAMDLLTINDIPEHLKNEILQDGNRHFILSCRNRNPIKYILILKNIIKEKKYDIVYVHGNSATMAVDLMGAKLGGCNVRVAHSHNTQCDHEKINKILMPVFSNLYTDCCACSVEAGEFLFGRKECFVVNNGLYLPKYEFNETERNQIRKKLGISDKVVIGHIGRFSHQKNQEFLVRLTEKMISNKKNVVLLLVGCGDTEKQIKEMVKEKQLTDNVIFYGTTDYVNRVVQAMDCFVFPSRFEGLGIVALEAQASGINCVASDQVPRKMKVNTGTTFISLESSIDDWIKAIDESLCSIENRRINTKKEKALFQEAGYDIEQNCKEMLKYYQKILS